MGAFGIQSGQMIDEYKIISKIGRGGMANVYKAYQASMDRFVAIKILSFQLIDNEEFLGRFKQEARMIARLEHSNILPIYAYGEDHGIPYLVMRFLNAGTLKDYLVSKIPSPDNKLSSAVKINPTPLNLQEIDSIFSQVAEALSYAHENGVIHRDIKPSNIMLDHRGTVFLTDFGIAKLIESAMGNKETVPQFTATGAITGTPDYMSPEQAQGLRLDPRSDIYSLGIVLFEMLTGKVPFDAETPMAVIMKQISEPPPPPSSFNPNLHPALEGVVVKALEKSPNARYTNMPNFLQAWKTALGVAVGYNGSNDAASPSIVAKTFGDGYNGVEYNSAEENGYIRRPPVKITPTPAAPEPVTPAGGALHGLEDGSFPVTNTPLRINSSMGTPVGSSSSALGTTAALGTTSPPTAAIASPQPASSTIDEENKFLLKNLQLSKTASSRDNSMANRLVTNPAHQQNRRILMIAGAVALAILVIIGLATALNVFDFIREARQIPLGRIPGSPFIL